MLMILQVLNLQISNKPRKDKHKMDEQKTILDHKFKSIRDIVPLFELYLRIIPQQMWC